MRCLLFLMCFIKIAFNEKRDNIGSGPIDIPPMEMHTNSTWVSFGEEYDSWNEDRLSEALEGASKALHSFIPLFIHCDRSDVSVVPQVKATHSERPTVFVYDSYPGGIGLSEKVYDVLIPLIKETISHVSNCSCVNGCPACIGPRNTLDQTAKSDTINILKSIL